MEVEICILPRNSYDRTEVLHVVESYDITRAALILHKGGVTTFVEGSSSISTTTDPFSTIYIGGGEHFTRFVE